MINYDQFMVLNRRNRIGPWDLQNTFHLRNLGDLRTELYRLH